LLERSFAESHYHRVRLSRLLNPDFTLHWISYILPDHWRHEPACHCWLSDNIPLTLKSPYGLYAVSGQKLNRGTSMQ
jgi:hypothetical protein